MIDYDKINKQIQQKKWEKINHKSADSFTCYYDEYNHHDICPHQHQCILSKEFQELRSKITQDKMKKKQLEEIYRDVARLKKQHPEKKVSEFYVGFNLKQNRIERMMLKNNIIENYKKLKNLKTKKGGF